MTGRDRGVALIITMIAVVMIAGMSVALLNIGMVRSRATDFRAGQGRAFQLAQAASERARARIASGGPDTASFGVDFFADWGADSDEFAGGEYFAVVTKVSEDDEDDDTYRIRAGGRWGESVAEVEALVVATELPQDAATEKPFLGGAFSAGTLSMSGGSTDSYNSDDGPYGTGPIGSNGDIGSNEDIVLTGTANVNGDASASGTVSGGEDHVAGIVTEGVEERDLPSVTDIGPELADPANNDNASIGLAIGGDLGGNQDNTLPSGSYYLGDLEVENNKTLTLVTPCTVYVSGGLEVKPNGQIIIDASGGGSAVLHLANGGTIKGATSVDASSALPPSAFQIYSPGTAEIILKTPHVTSSATIYAPDAPVTVQANAEIIGSIVGSTVNLVSANTTIHYDEALKDLSVEVEPPEDQPPPPWEVEQGYVVWRQTESGVLPQGAE
jgi:hypothetical protein